MPTGRAVGQVTQVEGQVTAVSGGDIRTLETGGEIFTGDILRSGEESAATVVFTDGTLMSLGAGSELGVDDYVFDPDGSEAPRMLLEAARGAFRLVTGTIAEERPEGVRVTNPLGEIGIRGTALHIDSDGVERLVVVLLDLTPGHSLLVTDILGRSLLLTAEGTGYLLTPDGVGAGLLLSMDRVQELLGESPEWLDLEGVRLTPSPEVEDPSVNPQGREAFANLQLFSMTPSAEAAAGYETAVAAALIAGDSGLLQDDRWWEAGATGETPPDEPLDADILEADAGPGDGVPTIQGTPLGGEFLQGTALDERILSGGGGDILRGLGGDDTLLSEGGGSNLQGGAGNDSLVGESDPAAPNDAASFDETALGTGGVTVEYADDVTATATYNGFTDTLVNIDVIEGTAQDDLIDGSAGSSSRRFEGRQGDDTLIGGSGDDTLLGGEGADSIVGGPGADSIIAGQGNDTVDGGAGNDLFTLADLAAPDVIIDFEAGDRFLLDSNVFNSLNGTANGQLQGTQFVVAAGTPGTTVSTSIVYTTANNRLYYHPGAITSTLIATLQTDGGGAPTVAPTAGNFFLF